MKHLLLFFLLIFADLLFAQTLSDRLPWSARRKLTVNNLQQRPGTSVYFFAFGIERISGFDFASRNFNKKVTNHFLPAASFIDPNSDTAFTLRWIQLQFDLSEVYARSLRKELKAQRKTILWGMDVMKRLESEATNQFSERLKNLYDETSHGQNRLRLFMWEQQVQKELQELSAYAYDAL